MDGLQIGTVIAGRFLVEHLIAEGGMCRVYAAQHTLTRKHLALKVLRRAHAANPSTRRRFLREARAACAVRHPNVLEIDDVIELADSTLVLVMDRLEGESLAKKLSRRERLPLAELAPILVQVIDAVSAAHAIGIVHRDLKPGNIFVGPSSGGVPSVKVIDFGVAKLTATDGDAERTDTETRQGEMLGTPYYMAPEQVLGETAVDHRADVWAIGVILYEALSGARPVDGETVPQILLRVARGTIVPIEQRVPGLPRRLVVLIGRMLRKDLHERPSDLRELRHVLREHAARPGALEAANRTPSQRPVGFSIAPSAAARWRWTSSVGAGLALAIALAVTQLPRRGDATRSQVAMAGLAGAALARQNPGSPEPAPATGAPAEAAAAGPALRTARVPPPLVAPRALAIAMAPAVAQAPLPTPGAITASAPAEAVPAARAAVPPTTSRGMALDRENPWASTDAPAANAP